MQHVLILTDGTQDYLFADNALEILRHYNDTVCIQVLSKDNDKRNKAIGSVIFTN